jgi:hypothetical protein
MDCDDPEKDVLTGNGLALRGEARAAEMCRRMSGREIVLRAFAP